jgi:glycine oxidase
MEQGLSLGRPVRTPRVYLVPKRNGALRVGATSEDAGFDTRATAGAVYGLLQAAIEAVPAVYELELVETLARLRPLSENRLPLVEKTPLKHYYRASGHGRSGILLAPLAAERLLCAFA